MALHFDLHGLTAKGGRNNNQDAWQSAAGDGQLCCVVCDGAGGHAGGAEASAIAAREAFAWWQRAPGYTGAQMAAALMAADRAVQAAQAADPELADMRTTAVMLAIDTQSGRAAWASVGDSRLYLFRDGTEIFRTRDHSLVEELLQAGVLSGDPSRTHPRRNVLTAALGGRDTEIRSGPADIIATPGDSFLLCSDGFWEYVYEPDILEALASPDCSAAAVLARLEVLLLERAPSQHDNYTAVLVRVLAAPAELSRAPGAAG